MSSLAGPARFASATGLVVAGWLAGTGCGPAAGQGADAGLSADAGPLANGPLPYPLFRMDDGADSATHTRTYQAVVTSDTSTLAGSVPLDLGNISPAMSLLFVSNASAQTETLFYTLPAGFFLTLAPTTNIQLEYAQLVETSGTSYGVRVEDLSGNLKMLSEDAPVGSAFSLMDRLGFDFTLDTQQPTLTDTATCGVKVHYPAIVSQGGVMKQIYPGASAVFVVNGANLEFTVFDAYQIQNSTCGSAPPYSIEYIVQPAG